MHPSNLEVLRNIRCDYGDLTSLAHSISHVGVRVPLAYYRLHDKNVLWDGHRRLRCVQILNFIYALRTDGIEDSGEFYAELKKAGLLDNAHINVVNLKDIGLGEMVRVPTVEMEPPEDSSYSAQFQLLSAHAGLREPLNAMEEAESFRILLKSDDYTQADVANLVGRSEAYVSRRLGLLDLHPDFQKAVIDGSISPSAAEELLALKDDTDDSLRRSLIATKTVKRIAERVEAANAALDAPEPQPMPKIEGDPLLLALQEQAKLKVSELVAGLDDLSGLVERVEVDLEPLRRAVEWLST